MTTSAWGGGDVHLVGSDRQAVPDLPHRQTGHAGEQRREQALVGGVQVLDQDEGQPGRGGEWPQELREGLQAPGRGPDADNGTGGLGRERLARRLARWWGGYGLRRGGVGVGLVRHGAFLLTVSGRRRRCRGEDSRATPAPASARSIREAGACRGAMAPSIGGRVRGL
jgi:hypothetical protein